MMTPAQAAFVALQATARNTTGLDDARALILQARRIRRQRFMELVEEAQNERILAGPIRMAAYRDEAEPKTNILHYFQQAA